MKTKGNIAIVLIVIFLLLVIIGLVAFLFYKMPTFLTDLIGGKKQTEQLINYTSINLVAYNTENLKIATNYMLKEDDIKVAYGVLVSDKLEAFPQFNQNKTYILYTWSNDYYLGSSICNNTIDTCKVINTKIGVMKLSLAKKEEYVYTTILSISNGTIAQPIYCFGWTSNILQIKMSLTRVDVPSYLKRTYDYCFEEKDDLTETTSHDVQVIFFDKPNKDELKILVMDKNKFLNDIDLLTEDYIFNGNDLGAINQQQTIYFIQTFK